MIIRGYKCFGIGGTLGASRKSFLWWTVLQKCMETVVIRRTTNIFPIEEPTVPKEPSPEPPVNRSPLQDDPPRIIINYPQTGRKILPVGSTTINVKQKKVTLPGGDVEPIYAARPIKTCRSFLIYVDQPVDIRLTRRGTLLFGSSIFPEWTRVTDAPEFGNINITTTTDTSFYIAMAEDPDGVPEYMPDRRLSPAAYLGYNAADELVSIKKNINGTVYRRDIDDPDIADKVVTKWVEYGAWTPT